MKNYLYKKYIETSFNTGEYIRIGDNRNLNLYIGKDGKGLYSFEMIGNYRPHKIMSSEVIVVTQFQDGNNFSIRFSLQNEDLLEYFCTFCEDLIQSTDIIGEDETAYKTLISRYYAWRKLFKPNSTRLTESEIMGLLGELLFLRDYMIPNYGVPDSLASWMGPERIHKDFSTKDIWYEVKSISSGKESVRISSLEQLDSNDDGYLCVYGFEKMSPSYNGLKLNEVVTSIMNNITDVTTKDIFMMKLELYGFEFNPENDNYVYEQRNLSYYSVRESFPRLLRKDIPMSISRVQYDITLSDIELFKVESI